MKKIFILTGEASGDKLAATVIEKIQKRAEAGYKKYGVGLDKDEQTLDTWLNHLQEELMDAVNYIEKVKDILPHLEFRHKPKKWQYNKKQY